VKSAAKKTAQVHGRENPFVALFQKSQQSPSWFDALLLVSRLNNWRRKQTNLSSRLEFKHIRKEQKRMDALWEAGLLTVEEDQRCHASPTGTMI
jgi:hypothetical protein